MLVLSRKNRESVVVGGGGGFPGLLKVTVLEVNGSKVKLGFEVAEDIPVHRLEVWGLLRRRRAGTVIMAYSSYSRQLLARCHHRGELPC